eukprot:9019957-Ditylum_brightwellii.AAC.1
MSLDRCAICSCMYMRNVRLDHRPCFMMVVSEWPCSLSAMAPPAQSEWMPTNSGCDILGFCATLKHAQEFIFGTSGFDDMVESSFQGLD